MNKRLKNIILVPFNVIYKYNPEFCIRILYRLRCKSRLNLEIPQTYNEKLNWLKLYYRNDLMPVCADKFSARSYIEKKGFGMYLPKLYWHGMEAEKIPFNDLPDSFVIKSTSGSGNNIIVHDKSKLNISRTIKEVNSWLKEKYLPAYGEWHYKDIKASIIVEELLSDGKNKVPLDYKFFCFNNVDGKNDVGCVAVDMGRYVYHKRNIYDKDFKYLKDVSFSFERDDDANIEKPYEFEKMSMVAKELSEGFPHCRIDFFVIGKKFYIGEITFFNGAGFDLVTPLEYNKKMGDWIALPQKID